MAERCLRCRQLYLTVWRAPDRLWKRLVGKGGAGLLCPSCFDALARSKSIELHWACADGAFPDSRSGPEARKAK